MRNKSIFPALVCLILVLSLLPLTAAGQALDVRQVCALTVNVGDADAPVAGFPLRLYYVASLDEQGDFTPAGDFARYPVSLNGLTTQQYTDLARTLDAYARQDQLPPLAQAQTRATGSYTFENLNTGLYLVGGSSAVIDGKSVQTDPFLVTLPTRTANGTLAYQVITQPKHITTQVPQEPETVDLRVLKLWQGILEEFLPESLEVHLLKDGAVYDTVTLTRQEGWRHSWKALPKYAGDGHRIQWQLTEDVPEHYLVSLGQEGDAFLLTNTYQPDTDLVTRRVQKRWDDVGHTGKRPATITVELLCNGLVYDTQKLSQENSWQYIWENLPAKDQTGKENRWNLREIEPQGYTSKVWQEEDTFLVLNSYKGTKLPQTGQLWWPVPLLTVGGLALVALGLGLKKRQRHG